MKFRALVLLLITAMLAAACGGGAVEETTTSTQPTTTTGPNAGIPDPILLSYTLEPGTTLEYEVTLDLEIDLTSTGDTAALSDGEEAMPSEASVIMTGTTRFTHTIAEGPEPGTYEITIVGDFSDLELTGTIDGEPVDASEAPEFADIPPVETTVIVDEQGNIIEAGEGLGDLFGEGGLDDLGSFGGPGTDLGRFIGPPFSDEEVTVGAVWQKTVERQNFLTDPITTDIRSEVTGFDTAECPSAFAIDTQSVTSEISFDLGELLVGFFEAFIPEGASDEELAELEALKEQLKFQMSVDETTQDLATCFDAGLGAVQSASYTSASRVAMDVNMPDETTGELVAFGMEMSFSQSIEYRLIDSEGA